MVAIIIIIALTPRNKVNDFRDKYADVIDLNKDIGGIGRDNTYAKYLDKYTTAPRPEEDIDVVVSNYLKGENVELYSEFEGADDVIYTSDDSFVEWEIDVPRAGMYQIYMEYFPIQSRGVDIERKLLINDELPFIGAETLCFTRLWTNKNEVIQDNQGNDIRPTQIDKPDWTKGYFKDDLGYYAEPYSFYFKEGLNTISLESVNEPVFIKKITLQAIKEKLNYIEYKTDRTDYQVSELTLNYKKVIQGEDSSLRSSPSLYAIYDRSSSNTEPYSVSDIRLNM